MVRPHGRTTHCFCALNGKHSLTFCSQLCQCAWPAHRGRPAMRVCTFSPLPALLFARCTCVCARVGLQVTAGEQFCEIDPNGCATDGAGSYGSNEQCTIRVNVAGTLNATQFRTEGRSFDTITIYNVDQYELGNYGGVRGPSNVTVRAGSSFTWRTDGSMGFEGWTICLTPLGTDPKRNAPCIIARTVVAPSISQPPRAAHRLTPSLPTPVTVPLNSTQPEYNDGSECLAAQVSKCKATKCFSVIGVVAMALALLCFSHGTFPPPPPPSSPPPCTATTNRPGSIGHFLNTEGGNGGG